MADYLHACSDEPCAPSLPQVFLQSAKWIFRCGGFSGASGNDLSVLRIFTSAVEKLNVLLASPSMIRKAPRFPTAVLASLEYYLGNKTKPLMLRLQAGSLLRRSWGTLRFDDLQHLSRKDVRELAGNLAANLASSKTSGPGKRVLHLPVIVASSANLLGHSWIPAFLELVKQNLTAERPYLMDASNTSFTTRSLSMPN